MAADPRTRTSRAGRVRDAACHQRGGISSRSRMVAAGAAGAVKIRLPAPPPVLLLSGEGLLDLLAARLAAVQRPLEQAREEDEEREEDDEDEAGVGDDLVVRLAPPALAAVVGQRGGREHQQGHE